jgi:hypothetical protein
MTFTPASDLANYVRFFALYEDGSKDAFAVPQATLDQGPAPHSIARIVARATTPVLAFASQALVLAARAVGREDQFQ